MLLVLVFASFESALAVAAALDDRVVRGISFPFCSPIADLVLFMSLCPRLDVMFVSFVVVLKSRNV